VLARLDPKVFESQLAGKVVWDSLVPASHKARLWERFSEQHARLVREIEGDFDSLFDRAFLDAYEAQFARLARTPANAAADPRG
jgi:FHA domain-containing protein